VRVVRARSEDGEPRVEVSCGTLIDRLVVGEHFRVAIDGQPTLTTSPICRLEHRGDQAIEVQTANSVYLVEREGAEAEPAQRAAETMRRLGHLVLRARVRAAALSGRIAAGERTSLPDQDSTRSVSLASAPDPGAGPFHSGVAIRVTRIRGGDRLGCETGELGTALLLDDLTMGEPARFSLSSGSTMVTSPVCGLETLGLRAVQLVTRNSTYRFELIRTDD
jgi:hypothetical protein